MIVHNHSRSQTKSWLLTYILILTCIKVHGLISFVTSEVATAGAAKAIGNVIYQNFQKVPISSVNNKKISNDFQNTNAHEKIDKMPEKNFYKQQYERYSLPYRSLYNAQKFNQRYSRPSPYFNSKQKYNKNTGIKSSSLEYSNESNQFQRSKFPHEETYFSFEDQDKKSGRNKHENHDINFKFNIAIREPSTGELLDVSESSEKNEYYSTKPASRMVPQIHFMGISEHDLKTPDFNQNSKRYRKLKLNKANNINPLYKMSNFSNLRSSLSSKDAFDGVSKKFAPYYTKTEKLSKIAPFETQRHKYSHNSEEQSAKYFDQSQTQLLNDYDKYGTIKGKNNLIKSRLPHTFHAKLKFNRVKYKDSVLDEYPEKNPKEYKIDKYSKINDKSHINRIALENIVKLEQGKNHGIDVPHNDFNNNLATGNGNEKSKMLYGSNQNQTNSKKSKLLYIQDPSKLWNADINKYESAYWNSRNHSSNYKSSNDFNREVTTKINKVMRKNLHKNSEMNHITLEKASTITNTIELHNNNLIRHIKVSEAYDTTVKLEELKDLNLVKLNSTNQNERFSRQRSRKNDNFIQVQVFGDFLKNSMSGRHRKESNINGLIPETGSLKNQRTKRQEAIFIVMALVGVTVAIMSVTCIALLISRKRNKTKKAKRSKSLNDREQPEDDSDKITTLSAANHPASFIELGIERTTIQKNASKINSILSVYSGIKQQEETKGRKSFTNIAVDYEEEYFSDHSHSESEDEEINETSGIKRVRQTRSLPINRFKSYPLKRQSFKDIDQQLEPSFEDKIVDRMDFNEEHENTENESNESYRDRNLDHSEFSMDSEGDITLNKNIKRKFSYISLNLEENIQFNENLRNNYEHKMNCFQEKSVHCSVEFEERSIIKDTVTSDSSVKNVHDASRAEKTSLSYENIKNVSSCKLKPKVEERNANERKMQPIIRNASDRNCESKNDGKRSLSSPTNRHQYISPTISHNEVINGKTADERKNTIAESLTGEKSERTSEERIGSPWNRVLVMKPRSVRKHYSELDKSGDNTKISTKDSLSENSERKNFSNFSHEKNLNSWLSSEKNTTASKTKKNPSTKRQSWKDIAIKRCSEGTFNKPLIISSFGT